MKTDNTPKHTPDTPYKEDEYNLGLIITDKPGLENWEQSALCISTGNSIDEIKLKTRFIVKACNEHESLTHKVQELNDLNSDQFLQITDLANQNQQLIKALEVIKARINGDWDNPELVKLGSLGLMQEDILLITEKALKASE